ncbi:hypothetical protein ACIQF6_28195 [Kitasatospora sp. NPDC092948]|uniref:hypothetical protein n=1 Tax=Kitasatospora sp. NPDC092948 TaxID=3364088 RepID=UPI00382356E7
MSGARGLLPDQVLDQAAELLLAAADAAVHDGRDTWLPGRTLGTHSLGVLNDQARPAVIIETWADRLEAVNAYLSPVGPVTGRAFAAWLADAAHRHRSSAKAARSTWPRDAAARASWVQQHTDQHALAAARALLVTAAAHPAAAVTR